MDLEVASKQLETAEARSKATDIKITTAKAEANREANAEVKSEKAAQKEKKTAVNIINSLNGKTISNRINQLELVIKEPGIAGTKLAEELQRVINVVINQKRIEINKSVETEIKNKGEVNEYRRFNELLVDARSKLGKAEKADNIIGKIGPEVVKNLTNKFNLKNNSLSLKNKLIKAVQQLNSGKYTSDQKREIIFAIRNTFGNTGKTFSEYLGKRKNKADAKAEAKNEEFEGFETSKANEVPEAGKAIAKANVGGPARLEEGSDEFGFRPGEVNAAGPEAAKAPVPVPEVFDGFGRLEPGPATKVVKANVGGPGAATRAKPAAARAAGPAKSEAKQPETIQNLKAGEIKTINNIKKINPKLLREVLGGEIEFSFGLGSGAKITIKKDGKIEYKPYRGRKHRLSWVDGELIKAVKQRIEDQQSIVAKQQEVNKPFVSKTTQKKRLTDLPPKEKLAQVETYLKSKPNQELIYQGYKLEINPNQKLKITNISPGLHQQRRSRNIEQEKHIKVINKLLKNSKRFKKEVFRNKAPAAPPQAAAAAG